MPGTTEQHPDYVGTLLTLDQTAHVLGISRRTMERWIDAGDFPIRSVRLGRRRRWRRAEVERWLAGEAA